MKTKVIKLVSALAVVTLTLSSYTAINHVQSLSTMHPAEGHSVGEFFGGGIIVSVTKGADGVEHGLIASLKNLSDGVEWSDNTRLETKANSHTDGAANTVTSLNAGTSKKMAAGLCDVYTTGNFQIGICRQ